VAGVFAVATTLFYPPAKLTRPVPVFFVYGAEDGTEIHGLGPHDPHFGTTAHGNWVTWGFLDGCRTQTARLTDWGVEFSWIGCRGDVPVIFAHVLHLGHEWPGSVRSRWNETYRPGHPLSFTDIAWDFFSGLRAK
jgi:poly(3-hydroxybutyrate) depolymerase